MGKHEGFQTTRRGFLAGGALLGTGILGSVAGAQEEDARAVAPDRPDASYGPRRPGNLIYSTCLQCNTGCGIKCKIDNGVLTKIDGNPYSPWPLVPHLDMATPCDTAALVDAAICPKGQAGLQTAYDPFRLRKVLKRAGRRGEGKWVTIPFAQAIEEVCEGGLLFSSVPGEETRAVEGLRETLALRDADAAKQMAASVTALWAEKDPERKAALVEQFRADHAAHLDTLIDPEHPDLGPRNNQLVLSFGRLKDGRADLYKRFAAAAGTANLHGHTTVCQGSLYFTCKAISEQYNDGKFEGGSKFYWQADTENSEFIFFVGANLLEANYGPPNRTARLTRNLAEGRTRIAVADPRFSKLASKAWRWLPVRPGSDAALAMAVVRWMLDEGRYDRGFLACANKAAAKAAGELSWTNATWLVQLDADGAPGRFVRAGDLGIGGEHDLVALVAGEPVAFDPNSEDVAVEADLLVDAELPGGIRAKSSLQLLWEEAHRHTLDEWCGIADVNPDDVIAVAQELTSHGKRAAVDIHRGVAQHTNGFYNVLAWMTVNMLLGNFDWKGGMCQASAFDTMGKGELHNLKAHPGVGVAFGVDVVRHQTDYERSTLFSGYPAKRNWYPLSSDVYQEIIPSIGDAYPYPVKAYFLYMGAPTYSLPAGHTNIEILCDTEKVPLFVASDILVGPTSLYADYIFPDLSYLERWEFHKSHPTMPNKVGPVRQPVIAPIPETCTVFGEEQPICFETLLLAIAERLGLPGFGDDAFGDGLHLRHYDDFYLRCVANLAHGEKPDGSDAQPNADDREMEIFLQARRHLPECVFSESRWRAAAGDGAWRQVVYVLNRGGRFEAHAQGYKGDQLGHPYAKLLCLYQEKTALKKHSGTGQGHPGLATYIPVRDYHGNEPTDLRAGHDLALVTNRTIAHTKSRTIADPWLTVVMPENAIQISQADADRLGLSDGQMVKVVSATNPSGAWPLGNGRQKDMVGRLQVTQLIRPGVVSFALGFGHWASGAQDIEIDGYTIQAEQRRAAGVHANAAMWVDPGLGNTCMVDPVGGSVSFYDTHVRLVPA